MTTISGEPLIASTILRSNEKGNTMGTSTITLIGGSRLREGNIPHQYHSIDQMNSSRSHSRNPMITIYDKQQINDITEDINNQSKKSKYLSATRNNDGNRNGHSELYSLSVYVSFFTLPTIN